MTAAMPKTDAAAPAPAHGEMEDKPTPVPSAKRMRDIAAATNAPAITAAQDIPDEDASLGWDKSPYPGRSGGGVNGALAGCAIRVSSVFPVSYSIQLIS